MKRQMRAELDWRLHSIEKETKAAALIIADQNPELAAKFQKMAEFVSKVSTYIDVHDEIPPLERRQLTAVSVLPTERRLK